MASDWIPLERHPDDGKILAIAAMCNSSPDKVFCAVVRWFWFVDRHVPNGKTKVSKKAFEGITFWKNSDLALALSDPSIGWLHDDGDAVRVRDFAEWFSKSSKRRLLRNRRQALWRETRVRRSGDVRETQVSHSSVSKASTRRHDTIKNNPPYIPPVPGGENASNSLALAEEILTAEFGMGRTTPEDARRLNHSAKRLSAHLDGMDRDQVKVLWPKVRDTYRAMFPHGAWTDKACLKHWGRILKAIEDGSCG